ncbi:hypothetical protein F8M41_015646 [Gigaspora margarita]|uniref:Uncharacterized protein n=1 Tax=Gigaspora margarita TaxID=4874 RepID=A0A8H4B371_GIGMA|nr:hypothetical protein F8M41_015646 [Gigaspora margarita]
MFIRSVYTFILVAIISVVIGIPLERSPDLAINSGISLIKRDSYPNCTNQSSPFYQSSYCATSTIVTITCASAGNSNLSFILRQDCLPNENCIDYVDQQNVSRGMCADFKNIRKWNNKDSGSRTCSENEAYDTGDGKDLILGLTTYATTNNPIRVQMLEAFMSGNSLGRLFNQYNYTKIIKNYDGNSTIKYCFTAGTTKKITALAAAFG